jgi:hypothetical protein
LRKELWERYGVISFRVYQYPVSRLCRHGCIELKQHRDRRSSFLPDARIKYATLPTASKLHSTSSARVSSPPYTVFRI